MVDWEAPGTSSTCAECLKELTARAQARKERFTARRRERFDALSAWSDALKHQIGCSSCTETDPRCLDWHRADPPAKAKSVAQMIRELKPVEDLKEEMLKCLVYCANCYRKSLREEAAAAATEREPEPRGRRALLYLRERQRRALLASLVTLDAEIAALRAAVQASPKPQ